MAPRTQTQPVAEQPAVIAQPVALDIQAIENHLVKRYKDVFTKRELLVDRTIPFKAIGNSKSPRTGLWLSQAIPDDEANTRTNLIGRIVDRLASAEETGF